MFPANLIDVALLDPDLEESEVSLIILTLRVTFLFPCRWLYGSFTVFLLLSALSSTKEQPGTFTPCRFTALRGLEPLVPGGLPGL